MYCCAVWTHSRWRRFAAANGGAYTCCTSALAAVQHNKRREELHRLQAKYPEEAEKLARKVGWGTWDKQGGKVG